MRIGETVRQGDVLITRVEALPAGAKAIKRDGPLVLAHGEVAGHKHAIYADEATEYVVEEAATIVERYIETLDAVPVEHEEHTAFELPAGGVYRVEIQVQETDDGVRNVED
jgi:hypothetical protein